MTAPPIETPVAEPVTPTDVKAADYSEVHNPARHTELVGHCALGDAATVDAVVAVAKEAATSWGALTYAQRAAHLAAAATDLEHVVDGRAALLTREQGKVLWESQLDLGGGPRLLRYYAELGAGLEDEELIEDARGTTIVRRHPMGPTALIVPWNYPVYLCMMGLAPALLAGNPVIVKPPELAPLALTRTLALVAASLPDGVLQVVPGRGSAVGSALVAHPDIRKVVFTGGTDTGRTILRGAADGIKSVSLELGGNDPAIVLGSASLDDDTIMEICRSVFTCTGQVCFNIKRIYVERPAYPEFLDRFRAAVDEITVGDGLDERSTIGPLNNRAQMETITGLAEDARRAGARVDVLGRKIDPAGWADGHFLLPAVVTDLPHGAPLVALEQFGPLVPVIPFDDEAQAIAWANDTEFGLAASVWTEDVDHGLDVARRIQAGSVFINSHRVGSSDMAIPFGGMKQSGLGRNHGMWGVDECSELHAISHRPNRAAFPGPATWIRNPHEEHTA